ncbi:MAG: glycosyltransferase, partial [Prevotella sp.]|nr:glycosyltransferase [Prevotella sp.]
MPTYNCADYIIEAINSVKGQTYKNWELLIVDD